MANKNFNYFEKLTSQMGLCRKAAKQLVDMFEHYTEVSRQADEIHNTEHEGDKALHEILSELNRSFITPIDREDIVSLSSKLDDITDSIEDVANLFDMFMIEEVRPEVRSMAELILTGTEVLYDAVEEFSRFKSPGKLNDLLIKVNRAEEDGDKMHRRVIKNMYATEKDAINLMKWKEIFDTMESVLDNCEDAADLLRGLVIKNS